MAALNESTLTQLGMFAGGVLVQLDLTNVGVADCTVLVIQARCTPDLPWQSLVADSQSYRSREHILGLRTTYGANDVTSIPAMGVATVWINASGFTDIRVLAAGLMGSDVTATSPASAAVVPAVNTPLAVSTAGYVGTGTRYAREDHVHGTQAAAIIPINTPVGMVADNVQTAISELNTNINAIGPTPVAATATPLLASGAGAVGTGTKYAREDHVHPAQVVPAASDATPLAESGVGGPGVSATYSRADHYHPAVGGGGTGTVTAVSVVSANGFAGSVATATSTPAITLTTSVSGMLKGAASALTAATAGSDYSAGTAALATGILKTTTTTGALTVAVAADFPTLNQNTTGTAALATNLVGGVAGAVVWTSASGTTAFTAAGTSGQLLQSNGTGAPTWITLAGGDATRNIGYVNIPQNSQSTAYTLVLADAGKHVLHPTADTTARTITIPANASVAFPVGTAITFVNQVSAGVMTIAITTDTMRLAGAGTTGSRTLAANGLATALKITTTEWIISGTGLT